MLQTLSGNQTDEVNLDELLWSGLNLDRMSHHPAMR